MAEKYIDREAAANIFSRARSAMRPEDYSTFDEMNTRDLMLLNAEQAIRLLPAADVVEVVRCGECKYCVERYDTDGNAPYWVCKEWDSGTDYDGYCHYGAKMEDDDD